MGDDMDLPDGVDEMDLPDGVDDMDMPDGLVMDEEDKAIVAEVKKKGYYHARPKTEQCESPKKLAVSHSPAGGEEKVEKRDKYDAFQKKWDNFEDSDDDGVKVSSSPARISSTPSGGSGPPKSEPLTSEEAKKLLEHYKNSPVSMLRDTNQMKEDGTRHYKAGEIQKAIDMWAFAKRAIKQIWDDKLFDGNREKTEEVQALEMTVNVNMAQAYIKQEKYKDAISACDVALKIKPEDAKALFRKATACNATGDTDGAKALLRALLKNEPTHATARQLLQEVKQKEDASKTKLFEGVRKKEQLQKAQKEYKEKDLESAKATLNGMLATWPDHEGAQKLLKEIMDKVKAEKAAEREAAKKMFSGMKTDPRTTKSEAKAAERRREEEQMELAESPIGWLKQIFCPRRKDA